MDITHPKIDEYVRGLADPADEVRTEMERLAAAQRFPIIGPAVGQMCHVLARSVGARRVFECGSGFGYSTWWFARAVGDGGEVTHTDGSLGNSMQARDFLRRAGLAARVKFEVGDAREILGRATGAFDVVFNDIDKEGYPDVLPLVRERLRVGGLFICDNMLWSGRVLGPAEDPDTKGIVELTRRLREAGDFVTTLVPIRDGVTVSLRVS
ncbi:MAG: O-methyltransferase [Acidobacteria bacterium]|nr:O-methyltransferase [Acidobacteriota bacterium]